MLDNGGEQERQAIVEEVAMLRSKREADSTDSPSSAHMMPWREKDGALLPGISGHFLAVRQALLSLVFT